MSAWYNEIDPVAAQWLRNLIAAGHIAPGVVDERSIADVRPGELDGYTQCHFFAGIGVWSYALRLAGWPDDRPVWTGSCPCQPFSDAGAGDAFDDERDLWPAWLPHIRAARRERRPLPILGEQVASALGLAWLDAVHADLEGEAYTVGAVDTCAAGFGAPHIRQRFFWVAHPSDGDGRARGPGGEAPAGFALGGGRPGSAGGGAARELADASSGGRRELGHAPLEGRGRYADGDGVLGDALGARLEGHAGHVGDRDQPRRVGALPAGPAAAAGATRGFWERADWIFCRDGRARPVEPGTFPLAHGAPARVGRLRAYGNAINAEQAAEFIRAYRWVIGEPAL